MSTPEQLISNVLQSKRHILHYLQIEVETTRTTNMFQPPRFSLVKPILNTPCFSACRTSCSSLLTLPNLSCLLSNAPHVWKAAGPSTSMRAREHHGSLLLDMAAHTDPLTWLHAALSYLSASQEPSIRCLSTLAQHSGLHTNFKTYNPVAYSCPEQERLHA